MELERGSVLSLHLQLRERFRLAVDRHRYSSSYFPSTIQRWLHKFRQPPTSSAFYRKKFVGDLGAEEESVVTRMLQAIAVPVLGNACHVFMHGLNNGQIYGAENLHQALLNRPEKQPLLTVSNHVASMDDPLVIASLLSPGKLFDANKLRWTLCATDRCFRNPVTSAFFKCVKVLPVSRGDGIYQKGMDMAIAKLNSGGWVHIFPEGSRSRDGGRTMGSAKRGVGRLVLDSDNIPMVVPFVHIGMQDIMPVGAKFPHIGKEVTVLVGEPIYFDDLLMNEDQTEDRGDLYDAVSSRIGNSLQELKLKAERLAIEQALHAQNHTSSGSERAADLLQQIDWESLGMKSYIIPENKNNLSISSENSLAESRRKSYFMDQKRKYTSDRYFSVRLSYDGGMVSRIKGYMDPTKLMDLQLEVYL